jgi:hypothetical protein
MMAQRDAALAERDKLRVHNDELQMAAGAADLALQRVTAERDRMRQLLTEAVDELHATISAAYEGTEHYPDQMRRKDRDMDLVRRIRAALKGDGDASL